MQRFPAAKFAGSALVPLMLAVTGAAAQDLDSFGVLAGSTVTNTGSSVINGNVGVSPGTAIVGFFPPGVVTAPYTIHSNDGVAIQAQIDLVTRYNNLAGAPTTINLTGQDLGGLVLTSGVYAFDAAAQLTGTVTLDGQGNPNARFIFNVGSALTTASASAVQLINGAQGNNVFFIVGSSATLGTTTAFAGDILALTSITLNTGATILCGAALARNGAVTLDSNTISVCVTAAVELPDVVGPTPPADAIDDFIAGGGVLPPEFVNLIAFLSPAELELSLAQLSGEVGTAVAPAVNQAMLGFLSQISGRLAEQVAAAPSNEFPEAPSPATIRVLGYGVTGDRLLAPFGSVDRGRATLDPRYWTAWGSVYGDHTTTDGDALYGTHDRTVRTVGFAAGLDHRIMPDAIIGVAVSGGATDFGLSDGFGSGDSDFVQAAIYGRKDFDAAYVSGALAVAWHDVSTERFLTVGAFERFTASFSAYDVAGQIEAGYRFALPDIAALPGSGWIAPYAALQVQSFHTPSYSESTDSGSPVFGLNYEAHTTTSTHTELGARIGRSMPLGEDKILTLSSRIAWAHDNWPNEGMRASLQSIPGSGFTVYGAQSDADSLLLSAGAEVGFDNGFAVAGLLDSWLGRHSQTYSAQARLSYSW